jgi:hypothetical protein
MASNVMEFYNATPTNIASMNGGNLGGTTFLRIESPQGAPFYPLFISQAGVSSSAALEIQCEDYSTGSMCVNLNQKGDKTNLRLANDSTSAGYGLEFNYEGTANWMLYGYNNSASAGGAYFTNNSSSNSADVVKIYCSGGTGVLLDIVKTVTSSGNAVLSIANSGSGRSIDVNSSYASNASGVVYIACAGTGSPLTVANSNVTSSHFRLMMTLYTHYIYASDGTTPNGNLSASSGDLCVGCDSGKAYYCTGGTSWTAM